MFCRFNTLPAHIYYTVYPAYARDGVSGWRARDAGVIWIYLFWDILGTPYMLSNNKNRDMGDVTVNRLQKNKVLYMLFL